MFIDSVVRHFMEDKKEYNMDGVVGANGKVDQSMLDEMLLYNSQTFSTTSQRQWEENIRRPHSRGRLREVAQ